MVKQNILKLGSLIWVAVLLFSLNVQASDTEQTINEQVVFRDGSISEVWDLGLRAYDEGINWASCTESADCPNIDFGLTLDPNRDLDPVLDQNRYSDNPLILYMRPN